MHYKNTVTSLKTSFLVIMLSFSFQLSAGETIVIDVRTQAEWDSGYLASATHIPANEIGTKIASAVKSKDTEILLYCASGGRSGRVTKQLLELGYSNAVNLGGIRDAAKTLDAPIIRP